MANLLPEKGPDLEVVDPPLHATVEEVVLPPPPEGPTWIERIRRALVGKPRNLRDSSLFHRISLIPFLAWVGLGADGLSSSAYGPEEAFKTLGQHTYLAVALALMMATTVGL